MAQVTHVKLTHGALDEDGKGGIILRGRLTPDTLANLQVDTYQREVLPTATLNGLVQAFRSGAPIPDVVLGMRGQRVTESEDGTFTLKDPVYTIDGLQRTSAAREVLRQTPDAEPYLGATVHFGTKREWERQLFHDLNGPKRVKLSSNVLARNLHETNAAIGMLYRLCQDHEFVLAKRVCWQQRMRRDELINAITLFYVTCVLHAQFAPGISTSGLDQMAGGLTKAVQVVGRNNMRANVLTFFNTIDRAWGVRNVTFKHGASHLRLTFMRSLARLLGEHSDFWRGTKLLVTAPNVRKLAQFPITDPTVRSLASSSGQGSHLLLQLMLDHMNKGRQKRLERRPLKAVSSGSTSGSAPISAAPMAAKGAER